MCKRNRTIDVMRLLFSIIIVLFHSKSFLSEFRPFSGGFLAVEFYFLVSGFLMAQSSLKYEGNNIGNETKEFIMKKAGSVFPEMAVAWVIGFIITEWNREYINIGLLAKDFLIGLLDMTFLRSSGLRGIGINSVVWYLSAVILSMMILFPLLIKNRNVFMNILAPLIAIFLLGYLCKTYGTINSPSKWTGLFYKGFLRGMAEIALGCVCWEKSQSIKRVEFTSLGKYILTGIEIGCYIFSIYWMWGHTTSKMDFIILALLAIAITISFSEKSFTYDWFLSEKYAFCGKLSLYIYLGHGYWASNLIKIFPEMTEKQFLVTYIFLVIVTVLVIHIISKWIRWQFHHKEEGVLKWFVNISGGRQEL